MTLPVNIDATWLNPASVSYNAQELRRADATLFNGDGSGFGVRGGIVLHGDTSLQVSVNASDVVTVQAGAVVIPGNSGVGNGAYRCALGAADTGTLSARNATNPRVTLVVFRALDTDVVAGHGAYTGRIEFIDGVPAASPAAPALPAMAVELGRILVPATGGGAATVDSTFRTYAASVGGMLTVPTAARLPATDTKWDKAVAQDTGFEYRWNGASWDQLTGLDTPWTPLTPFMAANFVAYPGWRQPEFCRVGNIVYFRGLALRQTTAAAAGAVFATMPAGYRISTTPAGSVNQWMVGMDNPSGAGGSDVQARIDVTPGTGTLNITKNMAAGAYLGLFGCYYFIN